MVYMNRLVSAAKLPPDQQVAVLAELETEGKTAPWLFQQLQPAGQKMAVNFRRSQATMRCAIAGVAAERFRRKTGTWPESINALVPDYLSAVPFDPFDGKPLRCRRLKDGIAIYSIGPDLADNDGTIDRKNPTADGTDIGFQLFDASSRSREP
jgi:hypothetical protein